MRKLILLFTGVVVLLTANVVIAQRELQRRSGQRLLLELAPVDPRSLMQGDYMDLTYALSRALAGTTADGCAIVVADPRGVAQLRRLDDQRPLGAGEQRLRYRWRDGNVLLGTNAWFFPEGQASHYAQARFGEFRASTDGELLLVNLLDARLHQLGPATP